MELAYEICKIVSIVAFLGFGVACLVSDAMVAEFERYGLARMRVLTGSLEVLGAVGLLGGFLFPVFDLLSALGLTLLMAAGFATRLRIRDPFLATLPALSLLLVNGFIVLRALAG